MDKKNDTRRFSKEFLNGLRESMIARRDQLLNVEEDLEREGLLEFSPEETDEISRMRLHPADLGTSEYDRDLELTLAESEINEVQDIEDALDRMNAGEYGVCQECGVEIPLARLEALPYSRYCAGCEIKLEREHRRQMESRHRNPTL